MRFAIDLEPESCHYLEMCCDPENIIKKEKIDTIEIPILALSHVVDGNEFDAASHTEDRIDSTDGLNQNNIIDEVKSPQNAKFIRSVGSCNNQTHECVSFNFCQDGNFHGDAGLLTRMENEDCEVNTHICCEKSKNIVRHVPTECGLRNKNGVSYHFVNGGDESQFAEFPWVTALLEKSESDDSYKYFCAGSLIHPSVVLTAAHCVNKKNLNNLIVRVGEWDTQTESEPLPYYERPILSIEEHKDFNTQSLYNDFALIKLTTPVPLTAHINTICLPPNNVKFDHDRCIGTGWGKDNFNSVSYRTNLKKVEMPVVPLAGCQSKLRRTKLGDSFKIHFSFMCAGGEEGKDTCLGGKISIRSIYLCSFSIVETKMLLINFSRRRCSSSLSSSWQRRYILSGWSCFMVRLNY